MVRDGEKGPVEIERIQRRVQTRIERKRTGPEEWLVVTRRPLADDRTLEPKASPDATDQDTCYRHHCDLTPMEGGEVAFKEPSLSELARIIKVGACIEASFKRGKQLTPALTLRTSALRAELAPVGGIPHAWGGLYLSPSPASISAQRVRPFHHHRTRKYMPPRKLRNRYQRYSKFISK